MNQIVIDTDKIQQLSLVVAEVTVEQYIELYNIANNTEMTSLADIVNVQNKQALQQYLMDLLKKDQPMKSQNVSVWDRSTEEGRKKNAEASKKSVAKRKLKDAAAAACLAAGGTAEEAVLAGLAAVSHL
jgi:hypothetical protein